MIDRDPFHSRSHTRRQTALTCVGLFLLGACSGSDTVDSTASGPATTALAIDDAEPVDDLVVEPPTGKSGADNGATTSTGGGSCVVEASGATEFSYATGGGAATISSAHFFPVGSEGNAATPALVLNCDSGDGTLVAVIVDEPDDLPFAPGAYDVPTPATSIAVTTTGQYWAPTGPVTLQVDAFDASHISGSTSFEAADSTGATVTVTVTFDLDNPVPG